MDNAKLRLKEAVIVEGRYDRIKLSELIASPIIETGGFRIFKDSERRALIRQIAATRGLLVMTDVDAAGFVIRNFLKGLVPEQQIKHAYIPTLQGQESRKSEPSKEGLLGVEGMTRDALIEAIRRSGATILGEENNSTEEISKADFYACGLSGRAHSATFRTAILRDLGLPVYLSANAMIASVNCLFSKAEFEQYLREKSAILFSNPNE